MVKRSNQLQNCCILMNRGVRVAILHHYCSSLRDANQVRTIKQKFSCQERLSSASCSATNRIFYSTSYALLSLTIVFRL